MTVLAMNGSPFGSGGSLFSSGGSRLVVQSAVSTKYRAFPRVIHSFAWIIKVYVWSQSLRMATSPMAGYSRRKSSATARHNKAQNEEGAMSPFRQTELAWYA